jgi:hypothetical protein
MGHFGAFLGSKEGLSGLLNGSRGLSVTVGRGQAVEKVGIELIATTNRARKAPKAACLVPDPG